MLTIEKAKSYAVKTLAFFSPDDQLDCQEIGDGNINYVFRVARKDQEKSVILKQADTLLRSSQRPLDTKRIEIEAHALKLYAKYAPMYVPHLYHYDGFLNIIAMEDIQHSETLRVELMKGTLYERFPVMIADFLTRVLLPTTDIFLDSEMKKKQVRKTINPELCAISETLVFDEPYTNSQRRNNVHQENRQFTQQALYTNTQLHTQIALLRNNFMNNTQAQIHGDLHSGSILISSNKMKIIDPEFSFYGPIGYDAGNILAHLCIACGYHALKRQQQTASSILNLIEKTFQEISQQFHNRGNHMPLTPVYTADFFKTFVVSILHDTIGYAGTEIIRRTVGDTKTAEFLALKRLDCASTAERMFINMGTEFILHRKNINTPKKLRSIIRKHVKTIAF